ncbi:MAG: rhomboid family intramembrane serine protease [Bacteroidota bacterium]
MGFSNEIRTSFSGKEHLLRLLLINAALFLFFAAIKLFGFLGLPISARLIGEWVELPASLSHLLSKPWTLITYMFIHYNFIHVLFNLLVLYWTGRIFSDFLPQKKLTATYVLGGLSGGLAFVAMYNILPVFEASESVAVLIGASAGVFAVMVSAATLAPNYPVHMILVGEIRLKYVAIALTILYLISIPDSNSGGNIAHLGGGLSGLFYILLLRKGIDTGKWIEFIVDLPSWFNRPKIRVAHSREIKIGSSPKSTSRNRQEVIDAILDKISRSGYESLSQQEKETLFKASGDQTENK